MTPSSVSQLGGGITPAEKKNNVGLAKWSKQDSGFLKSDVFKAWSVLASHGLPCRMRFSKELPSSSSFTSGGGAVVVATSVQS